MPGTPPRPSHLLALLPALLVAATCALTAPGAALGAGRGPLVAVVDSGVDPRHPALRRTAWRNPREIPRNSVDDDGNGFVDDVRGADFIGRDGDPADPRGHGTHVAGLIARRGGRRRLGRRTGARIMALRVLRRDGTGPSSALTDAIHYAVDHGARVINLSVAYYGYSPALRAAVERAADAGVLVVAAAGNDREDLDRKPIYPASFRTRTLLAVAASTGRRLEPWSARGDRSVHIAAPGTRLKSALPGGRYGRKSGTSQATAVVTRAAALAFRSRPGATARAVRRALLRGARRSRPLRRAVVSGRLDVRAALRKLLR